MPRRDNISLTSESTPAWCGGNTSVARFARQFAERSRKSFPSYWAFEQEARIRFRLFWRTFLDTSELGWRGDSSEVCVGDDIEQATFFPDVRLNYAASLLSDRFAPDAIALTAISSDQQSEHISRAALRARVERLAGGLRELGLVPGDRVALVARNGAEAVVAALAVSALGGIVSSASPEAGADAIIDRFGQIEPRFVFANLAPTAQDTGLPVAERIALVLRALPDVEAFIALDGDASLLDVDVRRFDLAHMVGRSPIAMADWPLLPFNHPLFILFSSGTTGRPKSIVHGAGGSLIEHAKEHRLHCDLGPSDSLYFHASCAWMMWNWQLSALASGVRIVTYSGTIDTPGRLWTIAAEQGVTVLGASPPYFRLCQDSGIRPAQSHDLSRLRTIMSTGSILFDAQFAWVRETVKDVPVQTVSGGTDMIGCFVLGSPVLKVHDGEAQCRSLGLDVQALGADAPEDMGDLVCANPFPSRPLYFYGDRQGAERQDTRFHQSYFAANPGYWTHGDLISISPHHGIRLHGRSDGLLNIRGIRVGPAEIYKVVRECPEVREVMAVEHNPAEAPGVSNLILLVVPAPGCAVDARLAMEIRRRLADRCSAAHVPGLILEVPALPVTFTGKLSEAAMSDAINRRPVRNMAAIANPQVLADIAERIIASAADDLAAYAPIDTNDFAAIEAFLLTRWAQLLRFSPIGLHDNFFDLGGSSLSAARLFADLKAVTGLTLPLNTLLRAPTIAELMTLLRQGDWQGRRPMTLLHAGSAGRPVFMIHSFAANVLELWPLRKWLDVDRPVYAIEAEGLDGGPTPCSVEQMATAYIALMRSVQPAGPYSVGGYSFGGTIAFEIARQLSLGGDEIETLVMLDSSFEPRFLPLGKRIPHWFRRTSRILKSTLARRPDEAIAEFRRGLLVRLDRAARALNIRPQDRQYLEAHLADLSPQLSRVREAIRLTATRYRPPRFACTIQYIQSQERGDFDAVEGWRQRTGSTIHVCSVPGNHYTMMTEPKNAKITARALNRLLVLAD
jgi:acetoacetyl-CoA synthetase